MMMMMITRMVSNVITIGGTKLATSHSPPDDSIDVEWLRTMRASITLMKNPLIVIEKNHHH